MVFFRRGANMPSTYNVRRRVVMEGGYRFFIWWRFKYFIGIIFLFLLCNFLLIFKIFFGFLSKSRTFSIYSVFLFSSELFLLIKETQTIKNSIKFKCNCKMFLWNKILKYRPRRHLTYKFP